MQSSLSYSQLPIWIGQQRTPASPLYNMAFAFVLEGGLDVSRFRAVWRETVAGSDVLRTRIVEHGGTPLRTTGDPGEYETSVEDLSAHPGAEVLFKARSRERAGRSFPAGAPLIESILVRLQPDRWGWYLNQHHLVTDAFSTMALFRQVAGAYAAGETSGRLRTEIRSYYTTAAQLTQHPSPHARAAATRHWRARLGADDRRIPLYGERPRDASTRSGRLTMIIDDDASQRIRAIAAEAGFVSLLPDISIFSVFATLLTAWCHRLSGSTAVSFDTFAHGRPTAAARLSLGPFVERFPFSVSVASDESFRSLGAKCLKETLELLQHSHPATGGMAGASGANVVLNYFPGNFGTFAGIAVRPEWIHPGHSDAVHALRVQVHDLEGSGRYTLHFDVNDESFAPERRPRLLAHFKALLKAFLDDPAASIAKVGMLTPDERDRLLVRFNATAAQPLPRVSVVERFEHQAARTADRIALRQGDRVMTFSALRDEISATAGRLRQLGVDRGTRVAVCMRRSIEAVVAILAIMKARGVYVPIDPAHPPSRIAQVLNDSSAALAFVSAGLERQLPATHPPLVEVGPSQMEGSGLGATANDFPEPTDVAYLIYTSGSTGNPKGVPIEHGGLADYLEWAERHYVRGAQLTFPLFTSLAFDLTVTSLFLPLLTGGALVIYEEPPGPVDTSLVNVLRDDLVDFIKLTPSHLSLLRQMNLSQSRIRRMVVGGEDFPTHLAAAIDVQFAGQIEIYNEYGPTEAVVGCAVHRYRPSSDIGPSVPIGRPADHVQLYVLNDSLTPVPEGVPGELCISRYGLAPGYHERPELTARQFVRHPMRQGERLYRTGDLVRFSSPETLTYLGRADRQLKISGIRVEAGEIEAALLDHDAISACVVTQYRQPRAQPAALSAVACDRCGIAPNVPGVAVAADGVCSACRSFEAIRAHAENYFGTLHDLKRILGEARAARHGAYDCLLLLSGGKDSTYALAQLVDLGVSVYAFTLDNGYLSDQAKDNIRRVVENLGVPHEFASTPAMNAIFRDSLERFSNVCNGCFKTLYTMSITRARELGIPAIVTGLSRGQFFETRLTERMFRDGRYRPADIDAAVLAARRAYHRTADEVSRSLDVSMFADDRIFEEIRLVDFYRYCATGLEEMLAYLDRRLPWVRPSDTGRSTNCLINDVGIYVHQRERGYHNYAVPYSWDVRLGQKTRDEAIQELQDQIDISRVRQILAQIDYQEKPLATAATVVAYFAASRDLAAEDLRRHLLRRLPAALIPHHFVRVDAVPLTENGKIDFAALPPPTAGTGLAREVLTEPVGVAELRIAEIWRTVLRVDRVDAQATFFEQGGTSIDAMEVVLRICDSFDVDLPLQTVFQRPTIQRLAEAVEAAIAAELEGLTDAEADRLAGGDSPA